ncbi:MAG: hypothetical protein GTN35_03955 [Nitrososphaeria archaeon]|nr:hypothetical protein [Nitrosopumilaceae archaeon]NIP10174.1 hypothetical protein [Nitrosopumilaceae archaeon]NIP91537.1 hypothetical protein [Nitrososphaeria archaeon]NIS95372.1 hypothetical protein [Nitrosopumilaceae archaeon]
MRYSENTAVELLQQAQERGLLGTCPTIHCKECHAIFPKEYVFCPKCKSDKSFLDLTNLKI